MPLGGLPLPQGPALLSQNPLQTPLGMRLAMYNLLLAQNPHMRASLPPLPSYLGGKPQIASENHACIEQIYATRA